jgi:hypothetical protein
VGVGPHAGAQRGLALVADVDLAGRIFADDDDGQARLHPLIGLQAGGGGGDPVHQGGRIGLAVDQYGVRGLGRHESSWARRDGKGMARFTAVPVLRL